MIITRIVVQSKNKERFNVFVDRGHGEEFGFGIDQDVLIRYQIKKGLQIDEEYLRNILHEDHVKKAYNLALRYLSYRMRSYKEVSDYLKGKDYENLVIDEVIKRLEHYHFVDDAEFANMFVRSRMNTQQAKGPAVIKQELLNKGITQSIIDKSLSQYTYGHQLENAMKYIDKQWHKGARKSKMQLNQTLKFGLSSKGFSAEVIQEAWSNFSEKDTNEMEALRHHGRKAFKKFHAKYEGWEFDIHMKKHLMQRGFPIDLIEEYLREVKEDGEEIQ